MSTEVQLSTYHKVLYFEKSDTEMFSVQKNWITCPNTIEFIKTCHIFARTEEGEEVSLQENILNQQSYMYSIFILN